MDEAFAIVKFKNRLFPPSDMPSFGQVLVDFYGLGTDELRNSVDINYLGLSGFAPIPSESYETDFRRIVADAQAHLNKHTQIVPVGITLRSEIAAQRKDLVTRVENIWESPISGILVVPNVWGWTKPEYWLDGPGSLAAFRSLTDLMNRTELGIIALHLEGEHTAPETEQEFNKMQMLQLIRYFGNSDYIVQPISTPGWKIREHMLIRHPYPIYARKTRPIWSAPLSQAGPLSCIREH